MLGSFGTSSSSSSHHDHRRDQEEDEGEEDPTAAVLAPATGTVEQQLYYCSRSYLQIHHQADQSISFTPPSIHMRQLLITCAELISRGDCAAAHRLTAILSANSSPYGDSTERVVHTFTKALSLRLSRHPFKLFAPSSPPTTTSSLHRANININIIPSSSPPAPPPYTATTTTTSSSSSTVQMINAELMNSGNNYDDAALQYSSSYLLLNQITPFIRFTQLTANQAILEAIDRTCGVQPQQTLQKEQQPPVIAANIHILDFDIMHGVQWPPLMQAVAERYPPPSLRITGTGNNLEVLRRTGDRLAKFAHTLGLRFQFYPLLITENDDPVSAVSAVLLLPGETLAVNCVLYLHRLLKDREKACLFLRRIRAMDPVVVTLAEKEANHNHPLFLQRFGEALKHYTAVFESLEATLPPNSRERTEVEQVWFGREISEIVAEEGERRRERHERYRSWEVMMRSSGFTNVALSPFALSQAKLLLRLHYPSEGYSLQVINDSFFLGWQNLPLFSVSSWH